MRGRPNKLSPADQHELRRYREAALPKVNAVDKMRKGRVARIKGVKNGQSKLTADDVAAIRASTVSSRILAKEYGISHSNIRMIRTRRTWDHG